MAGDTSNKIRSYMTNTVGPTQQGKQQTAIADSDANISLVTLKTHCKKLKTAPNGIEVKISNGETMTANH